MQALIDVEATARNAAIAAAKYTLPWMETYDPKTGAGSSALTINAAVYYRVRNFSTGIITGLEFLVTTSGGNCRAGLFTSPDDGVTLHPVAISASVAVTTATNKQQLPFTTPYQPTWGVDYWLAFATDSTAQFWRSTAPSSTLLTQDQRHIAVSKASTYAMDVDVTGATGAGVTMWLRTY